MKKKTAFKKNFIIGSKIFVLIQIFLFLFTIWTNADYEKFSEQLDIMWINTTDIEDSKSISRYDLAKLLNTVECKDCINTPLDMIDKYDNKFWDAFLKIPWKDFEDIKYKWWIYKWSFYYYCVAYVWDNDYMRWYPKEVSPVCWGKFCGDKNTTQAEFIQVIINLSAKYIYNNFKANRKNIEKWMNWLKSWSYADKYLNEVDRNNIKQAASVSKSGYIDDVKYFESYMKYCMFNIKECWFQEFGNIKQAVWPVAELNVLFSQNIIDLPIAKNIDVNELADGKTVLAVLYKLYNIVKCDWNNDYDCDAENNENDNCPNSYNPRQSDTDWDWIGDVCDNDIDWDWISNPIWIVDDNGRINISLWKDNMDKNIFSSKDKSNDKIWIYINIDKLQWNTPLKVNFEAITKWTVEEISRNIWDGSKEKWSKTSYTFLYPWIYKIIATAQNKTQKADAKVTILVWENKKEQDWFIVNASSLWWNNNSEIWFVARYLWDIDKIKWDFWDWIESIKWVNENFRRIFNKEWIYRIVAKWYKWSQLKSTASINIGIWENSRWISINPNILNPNVGQNFVLETKIWWSDNNQIKSIETDWWDWTIQTNNNLVNQHIYNFGWKKVIIQKVKFLDGYEIINFVTIYIVDLNLANTYTFLTSPESLINNIYDRFSFSSYILWDSLKNYPFLINQYQAWHTKIFSDIKNWPQKFEYIYEKEWTYKLKSSLYVNQCITLENQASIVVNGKDICLDAIENWTLWNFKCDMDKDNIPDICDDDIDWDWVKNLIWIISYEKQNCGIWPDNIWNNGWLGLNWEIDNSNNVNVWLLKEHIWVCSLDNAFPIPNPQQTDLNLNGIWDEFENQIWVILWNIDSLYWDIWKDSDGDWIIDDLDSCTELSENYNWYQDWDWCPEIWTNQNCDPRLQYPNLWWLINYFLPWGWGGAWWGWSGTWWGWNNIIDIPPFIQTECLQCPCNFSDIANDLSKKDAVRASLWNKEMNILYKISNIKYLEDIFEND